MRVIRVVHVCALRVSLCTYVHMHVCACVCVCVRDGNREKRREEEYRREESSRLVFRGEWRKHDSWIVRAALARGRGSVATPIPPSLRRRRDASLCLPRVSHGHNTSTLHNNFRVALSTRRLDKVSRRTYFLTIDTCTYVCAPPPPPQMNEDTYRKWNKLGNCLSFISKSVKLGRWLRVGHCSNKIL